MSGIYKTEFVGDEGVWAVRDITYNTIIAWFPSEDLANAFCQLRYTFDRYKHLDKIVLDPQFDDGGMQRPMQRELWKAIKNAVGEVE